MNETQNAVRLEVYKSFVERSRPPTPPELAANLGVSRPTVEESLRSLADSRVLVLAPGTPYIWMANPFSALPTPFEVTAGGRSWYGNCIWDAMGVVALVGGTGTVATSCPDCEHPLSVSVECGLLVSTNGGVAHFAVPAARWWDDIGFN